MKSYFLFFLFAIIGHNSFSNELNEILSLIVEDYNEKIVNLYLENKNFTLIFQELSDQEINILSQRFDERNWTINKILNLNNQIVIEVSQP